jgi:glycosyltransferase involved in cell wall biosynthesis
MAVDRVLDAGGRRRGPGKRRPRILIVVTLAEVGGVGSYIEMLLPALTDEFDVVVASHGPGPLRQATLANGARYVALEHLRREISVWHDPLGLAELIRLCRLERPDILHANSSKAGILGRLAAVLTGVPIRIFTVHGWAFSVPGMSRFALWAERLVCGLTTATVCVATCDVELGVAAGTCLRERTVVIHNGIDARSFEPARHCDSRAPVIVSVGRFSAQKDFTTLVNALAKLDKASYRARLIGSGPDEEMIRAQINRHGLGGSVEMLGERDDVGRILSQADVFVLASNYESLPISVLEAMAAGLPVVASDVGGVAEQVIDAETGFVVPARDPEALAGALRPVLADRELRRRLGTAGRLWVETNFGIDDFRRKHLELYWRELHRRGLALTDPAKPLQQSDERARPSGSGRAQAGEADPAAQTPREAERPG